MSHDARSNAFSLTQPMLQRYPAGMRTYLFPLGVVALLALVGPTRADFDSGGSALTKARATQATGTAFDRGIAATRPSQKVDIMANRLACVRFALAARVRLFKTPASVPQPIIKNPSNIPLPRRPANLPPACVW